VRTLPLRLSPIEGESLPGYLARYSHTFQFHPSDVLRALGLEDPAGRSVPAGSYGVWLSPDQLARVSFVTGIQPDRLELMLLARYAGRAFPRSSLAGPVRLKREVPAREVLVWNSRFCPRCLREDGVWQLRWQLGWSVVCVRHRELLHHRCPQCGATPGIDRRAAWPRDRQGRLSDPARCPHAHQRQLCRAALTEAPTTDVAEELVSAQRSINALFDDGVQPTLAGDQLDPTAYLRDLRVLANILYIRPRSSYVKGSLPRERIGARRPIAVKGPPLHGSLRSALTGRPLTARRPRAVMRRGGLGRRAWPGRGSCGGGSRRRGGA
jgi:hypothetical protein